MGPPVEPDGPGGERPPGPSAALGGATRAKIESVNGKIERGTKGEILDGAVIVREWRGKRYEVRKLKDGYEWNSCLYGSLSAVAEAITGTHRNGNAFFNITKDGKDAKEKNGK